MTALADSVLAVMATEQLRQKEARLAALDAACYRSAGPLEILEDFAAMVWGDWRLPGEMREKLAAMYHNVVLPALAAGKESS